MEMKIENAQNKQPLNVLIGKTDEIGRGEENKR